MNRVATIPLQRTMADAIQRSQQKLAVTQQQLSTGKKAVDLAALGSETVRNLSARTLMAKQEAHSAVTTRVSTTLSLYDANIGSVETIGEELRTSILSAIGTASGTGLMDQVKAAFEQFRTALNAAEGGVPLFSGSQTEEPFTPRTLDDTITMSDADTFKNDDIKASARVADNLDVQYGVTAKELGSGVLEAFKTLAALGSVDDQPTDAQIAALTKAADQLQQGVSGVRAINAANGRRQSQVETLGTRAEDRTLLLKDIISRNEDADLGQVAIDLAQEKATLEASYSVFGQLSSLSLASYIR